MAACYHPKFFGGGFNPFKIHLSNVGLRKILQQKHLEKTMWTTKSSKFEHEKNLNL